ncbi:XrtN system VIT domain-containing protein [Flavobacterium crocinum]|uniref:XrtN system VIT domain-containing protein n=1 Tax=Flavobacterium crocinum TaxID=2183896 RepID=A0A2S1YKS1_9FLAO|nr:XrtN system VIT domain-containing protein [Flavobacterium crocinum]AWK04643.1 XrtN system VIT domain-containing protein [Flavobacterium crocinum]
MKYKSEKFKEFTQKDGVTLSLSITSFCFLLLCIILTISASGSRSAEPLCQINLIFEFIYGVTVSFMILRKREQYIHLLPFLFLNWLIGCFSLNIFIPIFEYLPIWVYFMTLIFCISNFFIYNIQNKSITSLILLFVNGLSYTLILYYTLYLIPISIISVVTILVLGVGFYGLVPFIISLVHLLKLINLFQEDRQYFVSFASGFLSIIIALLAFAFRLNSESRLINQNEISKSFDYNEDLPAYIRISQHLEPNFFNEILLKKGIVYKENRDFFNFRGFDSFGGSQFNERKIHNPFITVAYSFCEDLNLSTEDRINILKSNFDKRLETEEQLWSGEDLFTKEIKEDVKIYPESRLAYTEITMKIACEKESWRDEEAIYSFQLPEGSVATSLSLWVNGIERKGVLTTKEKAQKAYKQIVGVESRDPSLMQWREGNKIVVSVFPVNYKTPRTFKCGFTTPLQAGEKEMKYQSISIKGPNISYASTSSRIQIPDETKVRTSKNFELKNNFYVNTSKGLDDWEAIVYSDKTFRSSSFTWKDKTYQTKKIQRTIIPFKPSEIILDLNSNWNVDEVASFINLHEKSIYVYRDKEKITLNRDNFKTIHSEFKNLHYSLLPLYKISKNSLIITKLTAFSANFEELNGSEYLNKIRIGTQQQNLKVINLSPEINPFWQTIKEQKYVEYYQTTLQNSLKMIQQNQFAVYKTEENTVNIEPAGISIQETAKDSTLKADGPNHIYRMYAFGKVLEEQVKIQNDTLAVNKYVSLAKDANIVTPISSLIVLETDEDYKKNGIEKNVDTLGNASIKNDGAVPEPHEWVLIIIGLTTLFVYYRKNKTQKA